MTEILFPIHMDVVLPAFYFFLAALESFVEQYQSHFLFFP